MKMVKITGLSRTGRQIDFINNDFINNDFINNDVCRTGYTALIKAPTHEIQNTESRPDHNTGNSIPYSLR